MKLVSSILFLLLGVYCSANYASYVDRPCGTTHENLWLDVVVVADNSKGMTKPGLKTVAASILSVFGTGIRIGVNPTEPRTTRLGVVTYSNTATINADLNEFQSYKHVFNAFSDKTFMPISSSEESNLANGLIAAEQLLNAGKAGSNREHYKSVVIVYASAYKVDGTDYALPVAERLKTSGVAIITVAYNQRGDGVMLSQLSKIASPNFNFTNTVTTEKADTTIEPVRQALMQANCHCLNDWTQLRDSFSDVYSTHYGVCIRAIGMPAIRTAAQFSCGSKSSLVTEYSYRKHDFVLEAVKNSTGFHHPLSYYIGLNRDNGFWEWDRPRGEKNVELGHYHNWDDDYPKFDSKMTAVMNQEIENGVTRWQNVNPNKAYNYVCETVACDTDNYCEKPDDE